MTDEQAQAMVERANAIRVITGIDLLAVTNEQLRAIRKVLDAQDVAQIVLAHLRDCRRAIDMAIRGLDD